VRLRRTKATCLVHTWKLYQKDKYTHQYVYVCNLIYVYTFTHFIYIYIYIYRERERERERENMIIAVGLSKGTMGRKEKKNRYRE
jgi:hypothetical protein